MGADVYWTQSPVGQAALGIPRITYGGWVVVA